MPYTLTVEGAFNVRDIGDFTTENGIKTAKGICIRSSHLAQLPISSQQQFIDYGVKTVIDLRNEGEAKELPDVFVQSSTVNYLNLPFIGDQLAQSAQWQDDKYDSLAQLYRKSLKYCQQQVGTIITAIAENPSAIVIHCFAGKDRTGVIVALILKLVGVPDNLIAMDYAQSKQGIAHLIEGWRQNIIEQQGDIKQFERNIDIKQETMLLTLEHIKLQYGGAANYLRLCGVTDEHLNQIKSKFLQPTG